MKKKKLTRLIIALIVMAVIIPVAIGVGAAEIAGLRSGMSSSTVASAFSSFITFFNARNEETALYVQKEVEEAEGGIPAPEADEFEFTLKINGEVARDHQYILFNEDGQRIYIYDGEATTEESDSKLEDLLTTDRYGHFTLKDGWVAKFEGLKVADEYEVTESETEGYAVVYPASEEHNIKGVMPYEGAKVKFRNMYGGVPEGQMQVEKRVNLPEGYEVPPTPGFTFQIFVENEPWANKEFTIYSISTGEIVGTGVTDAEGKYELHGDTYAMFTEIPEDVDYHIEEFLSTSDEEEGWGAVEPIQEGATNEGSGTLVDFTNVQASFGVKKSMFADAGSEETFTFQLLDGEGKEPLGQYEYYLYDAANDLVSEETYTTDEEGRFALNAGETAMFIGVEIGTEYSVKEIDSKGCQIYQPAGYAYIGRTVDDAVEVLPFVNTTIPGGSEEGELLSYSIRKTVVDKSNGKTVPDVEFTLKMLRKAEGGEFEPFANAPYSIMSTEGNKTFKTDENGEFTIRDGETVVFQELDDAYDYKAEEVEDKMPSGFKLTDEKLPSEDNEVSTSIEFENTYYGGRVPFVGGIGTRMFYIIGALLIAAAAAILGYRYKKNKASSAS